MTIRSVSFRNLYNSLWSLFVGVVCIISGVYFYNDRMTDYNQPVLISKNNQVDAAALLMSKKLSEVETTMRVFETEITILQPPKPKLVASFKSLFNVYPDIMQVRWIDLQGNEVIRLDRNTITEEVIEVETNYLQNKSSRYYFIAGMSLTNNELFLSQIDLNVENGVVQQPIQPTIRAVSKAEHKQMGKGLLVINYNLTQLLNSLRQLNNADTSIKVAVGTMRWILHPDQNKEWSLDLYRTPANIVIEEPSLWTQLENNISVTNQVLANHLYSTISIPSIYDRAGGLQDIYIVAKSRDGLLADFRHRALAFASIVSITIALFGYFVWFFYTKHYQKLKLLSEELAQEQATLKQALERQTALISELAESKKLSSLSIMIAGLAHELNTPVGATQLALSSQAKQLKKLLNLVNKGLTKEAFEQSIADIEQSLKLAEDNNLRAIELIRGFKRLTFERAKDQVKLFNVLAVIEDLLSSMRGLLKNNGVEVSINIQKSIELNGFSGAFSQIIQMIIVNTLEHAFDEPQHCQVSLRAEKVEQCLILFIKDNGKGIPEDVLPHLFEPFYTTRRNSQNTGLGLHLAQVWIKQAFDGDIKVVSKYGKGTEFILRFCHVNVPTELSITS